MSSPDVTLTPLIEAHAGQMLRWMQDPVVSDGIGLTSEPSLERTLAFIGRATRGEIRAHAVLRSGEHVGNVILDMIDTRAASARLSIYLGVPAARGKGVGSAALERALAQAFGPLGLERVWLTVHCRNAPAIALYENAGFKREGTLRQAFRLGGERIDAYIMAILRSEIPAPGRQP